MADCSFRYSLSLVFSYLGPYKIPAEEGVLPHSSLLKQTHEGLNIILVSSYRRIIDPTAVKGIGHSLLTFIPGFVVGLSYLLGGCVYPAVTPGLKVHDSHKPYVGELRVTFVIDLEADDVMFVRGN